MQGLGNVAMPMIERLLERGVAKIVASDVNPARVEAARARVDKLKSASQVFVARAVPIGDQSILAVGAAGWLTASGGEWRLR